MQTIGMLRYILGVALIFGILSAKPDRVYLDPTKPIDYSTLSLKYYPYIVAYKKTTDEEIATLINNLESAEDKNGFFIGVSLGWIFNNATRDPNYYITDSFAFGAKVGYQSFFPSLYDTMVVPNTVGSRIYVQYLGGMTQEVNYARSKFSAIGLSADILIDLPVHRSLDAGLILGLGLAGMVYDIKTDSTLGGIINLGFDVIIADKHRIEAEIKVIISGQVDWYGAMTMAGYSYVF